MGNQATEKAKRKLLRRKESLFLKQRGGCFYCGNRFDFHILTFDHVLRKRHGGGTMLNNLVLACYPCNQYRESTGHPKKILDDLMRSIENH